MLGKPLHGAFVHSSTAMIRIVLVMHNMAYVGCTSVACTPYVCVFLSLDCMTLYVLSVGKIGFTTRIVLVEFNQYFVPGIKIHFLVFPLCLRSTVVLSIIS